MSQNKAEALLLNHYVFFNQLYKKLFHLEIPVFRFLSNLDEDHFLEIDQNNQRIYYDKSYYFDFKKFEYASLILNEITFTFAGPSSFQSVLQHCALS